MRLNELQEILFSAVTKKEKQKQAEDLIVHSTNLDPSDRLFIYQNAYRLRLKEALLDDYGASIELLGEQRFEEFFKLFCDTHHSNFKTLNAFTKIWLDFLRTTHCDPQIKDLAEFEWLMVESFYSHILDSNRYPEFLLSEEPKAAIRLDNSLCLMESSWPIHKAYETKRLQNGNKSYIVFWTEKEPIYYRSLSSQEYLLIRLMQEEKSMDDVFVKLGSLGLAEEELAQFLQSSIANFMKYGFLLRA